MSRKFKNIGPDTLEITEIAPLPLLREILEHRNSEMETALNVELDDTDDEDRSRAFILARLNASTVEDLRPLEDRCRRIRRLSVGKGPTSLDHVARERLSTECYAVFQRQPDELCRSAWFYLRHPESFEDAEAFYAARQYRDHGKMYDSFEINAENRIVDQSGEVDDDALASLLTVRLDLGSRVSIRTLDLPLTANHPASVMVIVRHAGPLSSVFSHREGGLRSTIYYRPPNEATLIWTPSLNVMEICGPTPGVRRKVADGFAEVILKADLSTKPLTWRYYNLSRFHKSLKLPLPAWDDIEVLAASLIEVEMRLGDWSRRLTLRVTITDDIQKVAERYLGSGEVLRHAEGFSRLIVAVRYARSGDRNPRTLEISFGDRRSNLQSKNDPDERDLGYRLLQFWGVLNRLRELDYDEIVQFLPALLELHDAPEDEIGGGRLRRMGLDPQRMLGAGMISLRSRQNVVLIDEGDFGEVAVGPVSVPGYATGTSSYDEDLGTIPLEDVRQYEIKRDWLEETLIGVLKPIVGRLSVERLDADLSYLGRWRSEGSDLPLYFGRRLGQESSLQRLDVILRSRQDAGVGIVLTAGQTHYTHLGPNVVVPLVEILHDGRIDDNAGAMLRDRFEANRWLALGGTEVALLKIGTTSAILYIPRKCPLPISGEKQMLVVERLVAARKAGTIEVRTGYLIEGTGVKSPADAWPSASRKTVAGTYFENHRQGFWQLKTD